jgi:hypothetical protein
MEAMILWDRSPVMADSTVCLEVAEYLIVSCVDDVFNPVKT